MEDKLVLIDGNSMMNRAFYGLMGNNVLKTSSGQYTNAIFGFLNILFKVLEEENPKYLVVSFDISRPKDRLEIYSQYKAGRNKQPEELRSQFPLIKEILSHMNIDIVEIDGVEADDVIGTLSKYGEENNLDVVIISGDRDTFQLASDKTTIKLPRTKAGTTTITIYDENEIKNLYNLTPKQLIDVKALQGDSSDNIPGVPGIGEKRALSLINEYGSIEQLYKDLENGTDNLKGKVRESLVNNKELAFMSKKLGTINRNVGIDHNLENFKVEPWDNEKVLEDFKKLNLKRFITRFNLENQEMQNTQDQTSDNNLKIKNANINEIELLAKRDGKIIYNIYTIPNNDPKLIIKEDIKLIAFYDHIANEIYTYELENISNCGIDEIINSNYDNINQSNKDYLVLQEIFQNKEIEKYSYDIKSQYILFKQIGIEIENPKFDSKIASYLLDPVDQRLSFAEIVERFLEIEIDKTQKDVIDEISHYAKYTYELSKVLVDKLANIDSLELLEKIEMPTSIVLANMTFNGIYVNKEELDSYGKLLSSKIEELSSEIYKIAGENFNINSPKQLGTILFEKLNLPVIKKNKTGYSTDTTVLEKLKSKHEIIDLIIDYRAYQKLYSTYVEGLLDCINPYTKRIHSTFSQTVTATGRISSLEPNLQNIPTRTELGRQLRKVFQAGDGNLFIDGDYSQIELRVLAHISEDETMIDAFKNDLDIHKMAASKVFHLPIEEITNDMRSKAKAVNFGIVYGISDFGLAQTLNIKNKEAKELIEEYLTHYSGINKYLKDIVNQAQEKGYVETLFNRRRYISELKSLNPIVKNFGKRVAMNSPIQGTAADIMKIAMINVFNLIKDKKLNAKIVLQVHDEILVQVKKEDIQNYTDLIKKQMQDAVELKVPLIVNMENGQNWYECK